MPVLAADRVTLTDLKDAVAAAWSRGTSVEPEMWSARNSALGQCAVTALVVQDYFGGELRRGEVGPVSHYWNVLPSGREIDLTRHQFGCEVVVLNVEERTRDYLLSHPGTARRYAELAQAVRDRLRSGSHTPR